MQPSAVVKAETTPAERFQMYVDGQWVSAEGDRTFEVRNPADRTVAGIVPDGGIPETRRAIESAHRAFPAWSRTPAKDRGVILKRIMELMAERRDEIAKLVVLENGKPYEEAKGEVGFSMGYFGWFAEEARRTYGDVVSSPFANKRLWVLRQPLGVVGAITPWNFPANMITRKIAPAMAAGCTVVLKPASATPLTALAIARCGHDAGLPPGVLNIITDVHRAQQRSKRNFRSRRGHRHDECVRYGHVGHVHCEWHDRQLYGNCKCAGGRQRRASL